MELVGAQRLRLHLRLRLETGIGIARRPQTVSVWAGTGIWRRLPTCRHSSSPFSLDLTYGEILLRVLGSSCAAEAESGCVLAKSL